MKTQTERKNFEKLDTQEIGGINYDWTAVGRGHQEVFKIFKMMASNSRGGKKGIKHCQRQYEVVWLFWQESGVWQEPYKCLYCWARYYTSGNISLKVFLNFEDRTL